MSHRLLSFKIFKNIYKAMGHGNKSYPSSIKTFSQVSSWYDLHLLPIPTETTDLLDLFI